MKALSKQWAVYENKKNSGPGKLGLLTLVQNTNNKSPFIKTLFGVFQRVSLKMVFYTNRWSSIRGTPGSENEE